MAEIYEHEARNADLMAKLNARREHVTITVRRKRYSVSLCYNDAGEWYANAHARDSVLPDAHVTGYASREECLTAARASLGYGETR
jgi:hypothetical protein